MIDKHKVSWATIIGHIITIISLIFFIIYILSMDSITIRPKILWNDLLVLSFCMLIAGFFFGIISWKFMLSLNGQNITFLQSVYSVGLSVFTKYIPGKIWSTLGRANLAARFGISFHGALLASLHLQFLFIITGLIIGLSIIAAVDHYTLPILSIYTVIFVLIISLLPKLQKNIISLVGRIIQKQLYVNQISNWSSLFILTLLLLQWSCWGLGFCMLVKVVSGANMFFIATVFVFPLSVCMGLLSFISPGGIGIREGTIIGALGLIGFNLTDSTNISLAARVWFMSGELFIFFIAVVTGNKSYKQRRKDD